MITAQALATLLSMPAADGRIGARPYLIGHPGIGKTSIVRAAARQAGAHLIVISASQHDPIDLGGLPSPAEDGTSFRYLVPAWVQEAATVAATGKLVVIFIDEASTANPAQQAAMLRLVLEGACGTFQLPENVSFVLAGNPVDSAAGGYEFAPATANRLCHLTVAAQTATEYADGLLDSWGKRPVADQPAAERRSRALVAAFIRRSPGLLFDMPRDTARAGGAWPSPRSWEHLAYVYAGVAALRAEDAAPAIAGCVGEAAAAQFIAYAESEDLPDPLDLLDRAVQWTAPKSRPDISHAVLSGCAALVRGSAGADKARRGKVLWGLLATSGAPFDLCAGVVGVLLGAGIPCDETNKAQLDMLARARAMILAVNKIN